MKKVLALEGQVGTLEGALGSCDLLKSSCWDNGCGFPSLADAGSCLLSMLDVGWLQGAGGGSSSHGGSLSSELGRGGLCSPLLWMPRRCVLCVLTCRVAPLGEVTQSLPLHRGLVSGKKDAQPLWVKLLSSWDVSLSCTRFTESLV